MKLAALALCALALAGCSMVRAPSSTASWYGPTLTPISETSRDLVQLPLPKGKIVASVYGFRDQTGQYKPAPDSSFSTAVTQGAGSLLVKAIADSGWFIPVEREGLQNLLTERRIVRALETRPGQKPPADTLSGLLPASVLLEGGVIAYEQDVRTGGIGVRYFGIGASDQYRSDQVTVNLRAVDIRTGRVLASVSTTKTVFSFKLAGDVFRFVSFKRLLEAEAGYTTNEPAQLALRDAIEAAVIHLIVQGIRENHWSLRNPEDMESSVVRAYLDMQRGFVTRYEVEKMLEANPRQTTPE
ncbi:MAG TPA: CsgG/HfaB family protein [Steroidobacteraceae bacterium]